MKRYLLALFISILAGCASSGPVVDAPRLGELRRGETALSDVIGRFGRPSVLSRNMDGSQTAAYMHVEGRSDAAAFVMLMSALAGNTHANVSSVIFQFDTKGLLLDYKTTERAGAERPSVASAETGPAASPERQSTRAAKPARSANRPPTVDASNPWAIQLHPSGYRENR